MMNVPMPVIILLLAAQAGAQDFASMGRLFTTPSERAQLDAQRSQAQVPSAGARSDAGKAAGAVQGGQAMDAALPCTAGAGPGCPSPAAVAPAAAAAPSGAAGAAEAEQTAVETPELRLGGTIRRSHGPTVLIVNGQVQPAPAGGVARGAVTLQDGGRAVVLKPGQSYDPATGEIHEAAR